MDYWDYLGWPDRFAHAAFGQRQRSTASRSRSRTVYTPQLVLQGQDFRRRGRLRQYVSRLNRTKARADITLRVTPQPGSLAVGAEAVVSEKAVQQYAVMYVALYENNLSTNVTAGENSGRTLRHDFVVRRWIGPLAPDTQGLVRMERHLSLRQDWKPEDMGVVVCVLDRRSGDILQAVALPLH